MDATSLINPCMSVMVFGFTASTFLLQKIARLQRARKNEIEAAEIPSTLRRGFWFYLYCYADWVSYTLLFILCVFLTFRFAGLLSQVVDFILLATRNPSLKQAGTLNLFHLYAKNLLILKISLFLLLPTVYILEILVPFFVEKKLSPELKIFTRQIKKPG